MYRTALRTPRGRRGSQARPWLNRSGSRTDAGSGSPPAIAPEGFESGSVVPTSVVCLEPAGRELGRKRKPSSKCTSRSTSSLCPWQHRLPSMRPAQPACCTLSCRYGYSVVSRARCPRGRGWHSGDPVSERKSAKATGVPRGTWAGPSPKGLRALRDLGRTGRTGRTTRSEQVMSRGFCIKLSRRARCVLTPWLARAGMLDRTGRLEAPICPCRIASIRRQLPL